MNVQIDLSDCTLSAENQAVVDAINKLLALLPDDADHKAALRLAMVILEVADVAPQADLARVANFGQSRSLREYKQRLREEGLAGLWYHPIPGRPAITTRTLVEKALFQEILRAVIEEHTLPDYVQCIWLQISLQRLLERGPRLAEALDALQEVLALGDWASANASQMIATSHSAIKEQS